MSRRHVAIIAPPWFPLPPKGYGGIEVVVSLLARGLRRLGVRVTVYGCEGSEPGTQCLAPEGMDVDMNKEHHEKRMAAYVTRVMQHLTTLDDVDIVHDHAEWMSTLLLAHQDRWPFVHTVHQPLREPWYNGYSALGESVPLIAISGAQRATAPDLNWVGVVHNAVDTDALRIGTPDEREPYLLALARVTPDKGQHLSIEVAKRSGMRLVIAGRIAEQESDQAYFREHVEPHVDGDRVIYLGDVGGEVKVRLLARATALLAPLTWPEPFGLSMIEAMASGTPPLAIARGAAPELITTGLNGFVCADVDGLVDAVRRVHEIDPRICAESARVRFSPVAMAQRYLDVYDERIAGRTLVTDLPGLELPRLVADTGRLAAPAAATALADPLAAPLRIIGMG